MAIEGNQLATFGDSRRAILDTIRDLRSGSISAAMGMAIAANMKVLNDNVQMDINSAKLCMATQGTAHEFGKVVGMGQRLIANDSTQLSS